MARLPQLPNWGGAFLLAFGCAASLAAADSRAYLPLTGPVALRFREHVDVPPLVLPPLTVQEIKEPKPETVATNTPPQALVPPSPTPAPMPPPQAAPTTPALPPAPAPVPVSAPTEEPDFGNESLWPPLPSPSTVNPEIPAQVILKYLAPSGATNGPSASLLVPVFIPPTPPQTQSRSSHAVYESK